MNRIILRSLFILSLASTWSCSSRLPVQQESYAKLSDHKTFEYEYPVVWKAIKTVFSKYSIQDSDEGDGELETDWVVSRSKDKYVTYYVNKTPKRKLLQTRLRYEVLAKKVIGGVDVSVKSEEEVETLNPDGSSAGWRKAESVDTSRGADLLKKIQEAINSAPNT